jgi:cell division protein FtsN
MFTGGYAIRVSKYDETGNAKTLGFPKIAPWMTVFLPLFGYVGNTIGHTSPLFWVLAFCLVVFVFFGFFYYDVFKSERPKNSEEDKDDIIAIGFDKEKLEFASDKKEGDEIPQAVKDAILEANAKEAVEEQELLDLAKVEDKIVEDVTEDVTEETVVEEKSEELEVPTMKNTKGEIIAYLDAKGIEYKKGDTKAKLLEKI